MSHWNHRIIEFTDPDGTVWSQVHEVHYGADGKPYAYADGPAAVFGANKEEMLDTLEQMRRAIGLPALKEADFKAAYAGALSEHPAEPTK